jgi:BON domain-containing protein
MENAGSVSENGEPAIMHVISGPVRYFFLRKSRGQEDLEHWPPMVKPHEGPNSQVTAAVRLYATNVGWRAECGDEAAPVAAGANGTGEMPLVLTRSTVLGLLGTDGKRGRAEAGLLGVRVVNADAKGPEYATHFIVIGLPGSGLNTRRPEVVPVDSLVVGEYVEHATRAEAALDLRMTPGEYAEQPQYLPDDVILRYADDTLDRTVHANPRFTYGQHPSRDITAEVEAGRVTLFGTAELRQIGDDASAALLRTPGVVEVADRILYLEDLKEDVENALAAKGLETVVVLVEHALVILRGEVPDAKTRWQAEDIAKKVPGVRGVVNNLEVAAPTAAN